MSYEPECLEMLRELLEALGQPEVAQPVPPRAVWATALKAVKTQREALENIASLASQKAKP